MTDADTIAQLTAELSEARWAVRFVQQTRDRYEQERDEARRERDQLLDLIVVFDTPEYVFDGNIALTIRAAIDAFGIKCLDWVTAQDLLDDLRDSREQNDRLHRERDAARAECEAWREWNVEDALDPGSGTSVSVWHKTRDAIAAHDAACPGWRKKGEGK